MEIKWLLDFVSLANTGNFSRSAEERNVTQSAFSRRIRALESWLGSELVDRKTHPVSLTDAGIRFLKPAKNMIRLSDHIKEEFTEQRDDRRNLLSFTSSTNLAMSFLPEWLTKARAEFEPFDVKVQTDVSGIHDHFEALRSNHSDFLLHYGHGVGVLAMDAGKFQQTIVGQDVLVPVCDQSIAGNPACSLPGSSSRPIPYISPWPTSSIAYTINNCIADNYPATRLDTLVESSTVGCTKGFVAQGVGVAWLPLTSVKAELESGEFVLAGGSEYEIPLSIELYRYTSADNAIAKRFWDYVVSQT